MSKSKMIRTIRILLLVEVAVLIGTSMAITRDYQDSWILEGLEIPFAVFMATNVVYFLVGDNNRYLVIFATISRTVVALLPNLKYNWFLGTAIDQHVQFRLARYLLDIGHIETGGVYSETPIMHTLFASYSEITAIPISQSFKFLPVIAWLIFPAIIYSLVTKIFPEKEKQSLMKYALLISSIPIESQLSYLVTGSLFGSLFAFLSLSEFLKSSETKRREYVICAIIFGVTLMMSHFVSSALMMLAFLMILFADRIFKTFRWNSPSLTFPILFVVLQLTWIIIQLNSATAFAGAIELTLGNFWKGIRGIEPKFWTPTGIRIRIFDLNRFDQIRVLTVFHGADVISLVLAALGTILAGKIARSKPLKFLSYYFLSLWLFVPFQLLVTTGSAGLVQYFRVIRHTLVICPILIAISLYYIRRRVFGSRTIIIAFLLAISALSAIQTYGCQPLLPPSSAISPDLPSDQPVVFLTWTSVNSIYQRFMVQHIEKYASRDTRLAADYVTENQIIGLTAYALSLNQLVRYNPLSRLANENITERDYDVFLVHLPGKAGGLLEKAEIRTQKVIIGAIQDSEILYSNAESYILIYPRRNMQQNVSETE